MLPYTLLQSPVLCGFTKCSATQSGDKRWRRQSPVSSDPILHSSFTTFSRRKAGRPGLNSYVLPGRATHESSGSSPVYVKPPLTFSYPLLLPRHTPMVGWVLSGPQPMTLQRIPFKQATINQSVSLEGGKQAEGRILKINWKALL